MDRTNIAMDFVLRPRTASVLRDGRTNGRAAVLVLVLAMVLWMAATLGFVHRVVHPAASGAATRSVATLGEPGRSGAVATQAKAHSHAGGGVLAMLFGAHGDPKDCRLYDQLASGFATLSVPSAVLPIFLPTARFHFFLGEAIARWVTLFDARGPPASR